MTVSAYINAVYEILLDSKKGIVRDHSDLVFPNLCDPSVFDCTAPTCSSSIASGTCGLIIIEND
jgi:hypothetical protein